MSKVHQEDQTHDTGVVNHVATQEGATAFRPPEIDFQNIQQGEGQGGFQYNKGYKPIQVPSGAPKMALASMGGEPLEDSSGEGTGESKEVNQETEQQKDSQEQQSESPNNAVPPSETAPKSEPTLAIGQDKETDSNTGKAVELDTSNTQAYLSSLASSSPVDFIKGMSASGSAIPKLQEQEKKTLKDSLPEIEQPTGLPVKKGNNKKKADGLSPKSAKTPLAAVEKEQPKTPEQHTVPEKRENLPTPQPDGESKENNSPSFLDLIRNLLGRLRFTEPKLSTSAGRRPKVQLTGSADPSQNKENTEQTNEEISSGISEANEKTQQDFGENDVYPELETEMLSTNIEMQPPPPLDGEVLREIPQTSSKVLAGFNTQAKEHLDGHLAVEMDKNQEAHDEMEANSEAERSTKMQELDEETKRVEQEQIKAQDAGKTEVQLQREAWQQEHETLRDQYQSESATERARIDQEISSEVKKTNQGVEQELASAEQEAASEKRKAEAKAAREKRKTKKKKKGGFWSKVGSALSSAFDALKSVVNGIFDALRSLVKGIIEAAKKLVNAMIELARKAIVGLIKGFGAFLKGLVTVMFAAFPGIAKRINAKIDQAVEKAVNTVNKLAQALKDFANKLLDALGKALDAFLAAYQAIFNLIIDALKAIADAILKILEGLSNLASSAEMSPGEFLGQLSTELLGQDATKPLPNERPMPANLSAAMPSGVPASSTDEFLSKSSYTADDFAIEPILSGLELGPDLMAELAEKGDGFEFGEQQGNGMEALKAEIMAQAPQSQATGKVATQAAPQGIPDDGLVGPFYSAGERASHLVGQMTSAVSKWWEENKVVILLAVVAGLIGLIALNIISGGAVMAALPILMQIVSAYFAAEAMYQMTKHFGNFFAEAWPGNLVKGAQSLARGFAVGAIELVFLLLFGAKSAIKSVKNVVKTAKTGGVKGVARLGRDTTMQTARNLGTVFKEGAINTVKNGKFAMKGLKKGTLKGVKSMDEFGAYLGKKFRFRKFRVRIEGRKFKLEGEINPWVLLASGHIKERHGSREEIGNKIFKAGDKKPRYIIGIVDDQSAHVRNLKSMTLKERQVLYGKLKGKSKEEIRSILLGAKATADNAKKLRKSLVASGKKANPGDHAHHIIPSTHRNAEEARKILKKFGVGINDGGNGVFVSEALHAGLHTNKYMTKITTLLSTAKNKGDVLAILKTIESQILIGKFP